MPAPRWPRRLSLRHLQSVAARWECLLSLYFCLFFKTGGGILSSVLCGLFSNVLSWTEKKVIKKKLKSDNRPLIFVTHPNKRFHSRTQ